MEYHQLFEDIKTIFYHFKLDLKELLPKKDHQNQSWDVTMYWIKESKDEKTFKWMFFRDNEIL